jgi:uncharacterized protein (DUF1697 family)
MLVKKLERALQASKQQHIPVVIRTAKELESVVFCKPSTEEYIKRHNYSRSEEVEICGREIYIHYPNGMGRSKLKLPKMPQKGTVRNINTVTKLAELGRLGAIHVE